MRGGRSGRSGFFRFSRVFFKCVGGLIMLRRWFAAIAVAGLLASLPGLGVSTEAAAQGVTVRISKSAQTMRVYVGRKLRHRWRVSTGRRGYRTPSGAYRPTRLERMWHSRKYHMSPMPYSVFFRGGYAIHGTYETKALGRPASHGCVRLAPSHAKRLFGLVRKYGARNTRIVVR
jgi:lipoprotein-anchoring transpeptidase ErfK/SrfK